MNEKFPKSLKIRHSHDIDALFRAGKKVSGRLVYIVYKPGKDLTIGIICGKRVGNAVTRNRVKRVLREVFRKNKTRFGDNQVLIVALPAIIGRPYQEIQDDVISTASKMA